MRVQKLSLNSGFTCPREETCIFCNEKGFSPFAAGNIPVKQQIEDSISSAKEVYGAEKFIAYFMNATNTNASCEELKKAYDVIRDYPDIVALNISTRPDCVDDEKLDLIAEYTDKYEVWIEYGVQTAHDATLDSLNRGHTFAQSIEAINRAHERGIKVAAHVILGLPGETEEDMMETAKRIAKLPVSGIKLHMLHILKDTKLEALYNEGKINVLSRDDYVRIVSKFLEYMRPKCVVLRLLSSAKNEYMVAPWWTNNKADVISGIENEFAARRTHQGIKWEGKITV